MRVIKENNACNNTYSTVPQCLKIPPLRTPQPKGPDTIYGNSDGIRLILAMYLTKCPWVLYNFLNQVFCIILDVS